MELLFSRNRILYDEWFLCLCKPSEESGEAIGDLRYHKGSSSWPRGQISLRVGPWSLPRPLECLIFRDRR